MCAKAGAAGCGRRVRPSRLFVSFGLADAYEFASGWLFEFEAVGRNVGIQDDLAHLEIEAIVVMWSVDADVVRKRRDCARHRRASLRWINRMPVGIMYVGHQQTLWRKRL